MRRRAFDTGLANLGDHRFIVLGLSYPANIDSAPIQPLCELIDASELAHYHRIGTPFRQAEFLFGRALLRRTLSGILGVAAPQLRFGRTSWGKPFLEYPAAPSVFFNLSHTSGYLVLALSCYSEIGVDIERKTGYHPRIARRFFHPDEYARIEQLDAARRPDAFYQLWTEKEACAKALGISLWQVCGTSSAWGAANSSGAVWRQAIELPMYALTVALCLASDQPVPGAGSFNPITLEALLREKGGV